MFVVAQVRQALQHTAAIGACSPYLLAAWASRPRSTTFVAGVYERSSVRESHAEECASTS